MIINLIAAFLAVLSFALLFNVSKENVLLCGLTGSIGWLFFEVSGSAYSLVAASFISSVVITAVSRIFANIKKTPVTVFLISGIIPLVPGAGIYYTMINIINNQYTKAAVKGIETFKVAGAIAIGIMLVFSLPRWLFSFDKSLINKK